MKIEQLKLLSPKEGAEYLEKQNKVLINAIYTLNSGQQFIEDILVSRDVDEKKFIKAITKKVKNKKDLVKISVCQMFTRKVSQLLPFIRDTNGKFYF